MSLAVSWIQGLPRCGSLYLCCSNTSPGHNFVTALLSLSSPRSKCFSVSSLISPALMFLFSPLCSLASFPAHQTFCSGEHKLYFSCGMLISCCLMFLHSRWCPNLLKNRFEFCQVLHCKKPQAASFCKLRDGFYLTLDAVLLEERFYLQIALRCIWCCVPSLPSQSCSLPL